jgi:hypothetical protein
MFITDFFMCDNTAATNTFNAVMTRSIDVVKVRMRHAQAMRAQKDMHKHIHTCHDAIALCLCIKVVHEYQDLMIRRRVAVMSDYWADMLAALCARLEHVMCAHIDSLRELDVLRVCAHVPDLRQPHFVRVLPRCSCASADCASLCRADVGATVYRFYKH